MLGFSWGEIGLVLVIALLVMKPEDFPAAMRKGAKAVRAARGVINEVTAPFKEIINVVEQETAPLRKIKGDDGKWYDSYMEATPPAKPQPPEEKLEIKHTQDHERV